MHVEAEHILGLVALAGAAWGGKRWWGSRRAPSPSLSDRVEALEQWAEEHTRDLALLQGTAAGTTTKRKGR